MVVGRYVLPLYTISASPLVYVHDSSVVHILYSSWGYLLTACSLASYSVLTVLIAYTVVVVVVVVELVEVTVDDVVLVVDDVELVVVVVVVVVVVTVVDSPS
jgi:hypothetical protein